MPLYQGCLRLNKSKHDRNSEIIKKINQPNYSRRATLLAAALTCFAVAGIVLGWMVWG